MSDLISVVVPIYNEEKKLMRCVDSLLNQTYQNLEIILVDDGSNDTSGKICDEYAEKDQRIRVIHKVNGGLSSARNAGIDLATGEFLGFLDSDDWVSQDMYDYLYNLQKRFNADVVQIEYIQTSDISKCDSIKNNENIICIKGKDKILSQYLIDGMRDVKSYPVWTKLYKKNCFSDIRFPIGQRYEDVVTNYDVLSNISTYVISDKICYFYYISNSSITRSKFIKEDLDYIKVGQQLADRTKDSVLLAKLGRMTLGRFHFMCVCKMLKYGCAKDINIDRQINESITIIRKNAIMLIKSKMKFNRKLILLAICVNKRLTKMVIYSRK